MKYRFIKSLDEFITESEAYYNDTAETYIKKSLLKVKSNVEAIFRELIESTEEDNPYSEYSVVQSKLEEGSVLHKYFTIELHDRDTDNMYNLSFMEKVQEPSEEMKDTEYDETMIDDIFVDFKMYDPEANLLAEINRKVSPEQIDQEYILQLFDELSDELPESEEDEFKIDFEEETEDV